jgi:hypothetical protein
MGATGKTGQPTCWRPADGAELDLVFERGSKPFIGIEIKRSAAPRIRPSFSIAYNDPVIEHHDRAPSCGLRRLRQLSDEGGAEVLPVLAAIVKVRIC